MDKFYKASNGLNLTLDELTSYLLEIVDLLHGVRLAAEATAEAENLDDQAAWPKLCALGIVEAHKIAVGLLPEVEEPEYDDLSPRPGEETLQ